MLTKLRTGGLAALLSIVVFGAATPAYAQGGKPERCERKLERIEREFRIIERYAGWEAASYWWNEYAWPKYYRQCEA